MQQIKSSLLLFGLMVTAGCGMTAEIGKPSRSINNLRANPIANAICAGRQSEIVTSIDSQSIFMVSDRFLIAYAYEMAGHPIRAKVIYQSIENYRPDNENIALTCEGSSLFEGNILDLSFERIGIIDAKLQKLDVNFAPSNGPVHQGLPPMEVIHKKVAAGIEKTETTQPKAQATPKDETNSAPQQSNKQNAFFRPLKVTLPKSAGTDGQWFAHIASYKTQENANLYKTKLEGIYPELSGHIDEWQVNSNNGPTWRLGVRIREWSDADRLCVIIRSKEEYCRVLDTTK